MSQLAGAGWKMKYNKEILGRYSDNPECCMILYYRSVFDSSTHPGAVVEESFIYDIPKKNIKRRLRNNWKGRYRMRVNSDQLAWTGCEP
jgi:hypothetical protein